MGFNIGVVAGSFDPITVGHLWLIRQACKIMDHVIVVVAQNPEKLKKNQYMFDLQKRMDLIGETLEWRKHKDMRLHENIEVRALPENEFLVRFAKDNSATHIIRGVRDTLDFVEEQKILNVNARLQPRIQTLFLCTPKKYSEISSSMVKGIYKLNGAEGLLTDYVSPCVMKALGELK